MTDLERFVKKELENRGYTIYYYNLNIIQNKVIITEYDIVSENFIIEVKSGFDIVNRTQIVNQIKYLPEGYTLYYYCPSIKKDILNEYNLIYKNVYFINDLSVIFEKYKPILTFNIKSQRNLTKFLSLPLTVLSNFRKIYIDHQTYFYTYVTCKYHNDYYHLEDKDMIYHSTKLEFLVNNDILKIVDHFDLNLPFASSKNPVKKLYIDNNDKIKKIYELPVTKGKLQKVYHPQKFPYIPGITRLCNCGKNYVFDKTRKEICDSRCH